MRLTPEEHDNILKELSSEVNATPELLELVDKLRNDFSESLAVDVEEVRKDYENKITEITAARDTAIGERDEARRQYRERFWNAKEEANKIIEDTKKDEPRTKTINEILGIKEGV